MSSSSDSTVVTQECLAESLRARCKALREEGRAAEALALLDTEGAQCPSALLERMRALALTDLGRHAEALGTCERALEADPSDTEMRFARAFVLLMLECWQEALKALDTLVTLAPAYPDAAWMRASLLRRLRGDLDAAVLEAFDLAASVDPTNLYLQVERADILRSCGEYAEARTIYAQVRQSDVEEALRVEATFKLGCVALVLQEEAEAREALQAVLAAAPDYPDAREMLDLWLGAAKSPIGEIRS